MKLLSSSTSFGTPHPTIQISGSLGYYIFQRRHRRLDNRLRRYYSRPKDARNGYTTSCCATECLKSWHHLFFTNAPPRKKIIVYTEATGHSPLSHLITKAQDYQSHRTVPSIPSYTCSGYLPPPHVSNSYTAQPTKKPLQHKTTNCHQIPPRSAQR